MNKSWWQHPTRHQLYGHLPPITKTIQVRRTTHAGHCWRSKDGNSSVMYSYGPPHMAGQKQDDQLEHTYSSYVRIRDVTLKTCPKRWTIGRSGERCSGIFVYIFLWSSFLFAVSILWYRTGIDYKSSISNCFRCTFCTILCHHQGYIHCKCD